MSKATAVQLQPTIPRQPIGRRSIQEQNREKLAVPRSSRFYVFQWKEQLDRDAPVWKKVFFWLIYRPFNQFCRFTLGLPTFNAEECCECKKRLLWTEHQGIEREEWQAVAACQTREWGYHELPYGASLPAESASNTINHNYPLTDVMAQDKYRRSGKSTIEVGKVDLVKLAAKVAASDQIVQHFQAKTT